MKYSPLTAISPIDGRYHNYTHSLRNIFSEFGFLKFRVQIEICWLKKISNTQEITEVPIFTETEHNFLNNLVDDFSIKDAKYIKKIERVTNHDVKAIEYFLKEKINVVPSLKKKINEFIHFACTSEDINNLAYGLMLIHTKNIIILPIWRKIINSIKQLSINYKEIPILSRTHGQPASPSTMGKEMANVAYRLIRQFHHLQLIKILGKINGAVGNYNAHIIAYPRINWRKFDEEFVTSLGISWNPYTTQIEPHDYIAEISDCIARFNTILINFNQNIWGYISLNYFTQKHESYEIGSSTMPHKINPINFENSEGNLGLSNAILKHFSEKLPISRWQRDLSDSTVLRNLGVAIGYSLISYYNTLQGIDKLIINEKYLSQDLNKNWMILGEALQTVMKRYNIHNAYERTKDFMFNYSNNINANSIKSFIDSLPLPTIEKNRLKKITPSDYIGLASILASDIEKIK
ncbi:adenylosuccinate lyase [Candidatus Blochmanniella vafra]|uniref:adenylosuccinate lyase n=1 Tax=Candidatus Blochmanniella vafra TaxID=251535 RepID=UPI0005C6B66E|nr:adenylosuccinate lyase [Candidatus Blochmannia vafer]